jgi:hypothetical protein
MGAKGGRYEGRVSTPAPKVVVFLHSGDYDRVHQGLSIAVASDRKAECTSSGGRWSASWRAGWTVGKGPIDGWVGWSAILQRTAGVVDRFYL